jgi:RimJ/RimL family protein N-acetyltransferase
VNIIGKQVCLRAIEKKDLPLLQKWANDPEIQNMLGGWHFPTSEQDQERWFASLSCTSKDQRFAIEVPDIGLIGTANLISIDWKNRNAFHGMMLGEKNIRGKGYGVDTIMTLMHYAFDELGLARLDGDMIEYNTGSLKTYIDRCGWLVEGRKTNWYFRKGRYWDKIVVGITRERYKEIVATSSYWLT